MKKYRFTEPLELPRATHFGNNYWIFRSRKLGRRVTAFSNLEYENLISLEMNPEVEFYCEQPVMISIPDEGNAVPDVWVLYKDGREELQEVKYSENLMPDSPDVERNMVQINREKKWAEANGFSFCVRTEKEIHKGKQFIHNLVFLYGHLKKNMPSEIKALKKVAEIIEPGMIVRDFFIYSKLSHAESVKMIGEMYYAGMIDLIQIEESPFRFEMEIKAI